MKKVHCIGVKGVGMAPLAIIAKQAGFEVSGCDVAQEFITDHELHANGIIPEVGFSSRHLDDVDLVIMTGAHGGFDNEEVRSAKQKGIRLLTQGEAVGEFMKGEIFNKKLFGISITGCHGKTTTTAMVATVLRVAELDPSYVIGTGDIPSLEGSGHYGSGKYFVAEADEYANEPTYDKTPKFLLQHPDILAITNIEFDHPDLYTNIEEVESAYSKFTKNIQNKGVLIANGDDVYSRKIIEGYENEMITFGLNSSNDCVLKNVFIENGETHFEILYKKEHLGAFIIPVLGVHNAMNATIALLIGMHLQIPLGKIKEGIAAFHGTKRRLEFVGTSSSGALLYDDYAHHPTEIKASLQALRTAYPGKKIVCVFQSHTYSRTKILFHEFTQSFSDANEVIMPDIFPSAREVIDPTISSKNLIDVIAESQKAVYIPTFESVVKYLNDCHFGKDTIILTMGAGDVYTILGEIK